MVLSLAGLPTGTRSLDHNFTIFFSRCAHDSFDLSEVPPVVLVMPNAFCAIDSGLRKDNPTCNKIEGLIWVSLSSPVHFVVAYCSNKGVNCTLRELQLCCTREDKAFKRPKHNVSKRTAFECFLHSSSENTHNFAPK